MPPLAMVAPSGPPPTRLALLLSDHRRGGRRLLVLRRAYESHESQHQGCYYSACYAIGNLRSTSGPYP